ncbi:ribonuclease J [Limimonas halophila]|uniref:Ribonuclease J n=1 Tax=Limimonas halophila TaxID=1082479 RepID=A0A1G7N8B6_9PROT|nr:ribonuclease J [Limimonas halophila]SDF70137.1 ribonuclease J [Limimonas halophila]
MTLQPGRDDLYFLPLGGTGEVGQNAYLYGHAGSWLLVDLGISFADERLPGVDILLPDPGFIAERRDELAGIVITHAHEDHLGALPYLWERLRAPVYATPFTAAVLRRKFAEFGIADAVELIEIPQGGRFQVGPYDLEFVTVTHSVPEANMLVLRTDAGTTVHTGDWKLDPEPLVGAPFDRDRLAALGDENVRALVGDSTNALTPGHSGSEAAVRESLVNLIEGLTQRVAVTCFATNAARLESVAKAAEASGRRLALVGRAMHTIVRAAQDVGYLQDLPPLLDEREIDSVPRDQLLLLVTGSQGEARSALSRIAHDNHPWAELESGDAVIFSSRMIPGNEKAIHGVQNQLMLRGIDVLTEEDHFVHVSGHPCQDELRQLYDWVRPQVAVPMHGELRHLLAHERIARACGVAQRRVPADGQCIRLAPDPCEVVDRVLVGRIAVDGELLSPIDRGPVRERRKLGFQGAAVLTLAVDPDGHIEGDPQLSIYGLVPDTEEGAEMADAVLDAVERAVQRLPRRERVNDGSLRETARLAVRRTLQRITGRKPMTDVHLVRLG